MFHSVLLVNSVTAAAKGQKLLAGYGISSNIIRNSQIGLTNGCGYGLAISSSTTKAQNLLMRAGIQVLSVVEYEG